MGSEVPQGDIKIKIDACFVGKLLLKFIIPEQSCWPGKQFFTFGINHHLIVPVDIL